MKAILIFGLAIGVAFISCKSKKQTVLNEKNSFYSDKGGTGLRRIPLIEPYELLKVSDSEWRLNLFAEIPIALSIHNVKGVNVDSDKIIVYSEGGTEVKHKAYNEAWFVIEPSKKQEEVFDSLKFFIDYLQMNKVMNRSFLNPDSLYNDFYNTGTIKWE